MIEGIDVTGLVNFCAYTALALIPTVAVYEGIMSIIRRVSTLD